MYEWILDFYKMQAYTFNFQSMIGAFTVIRKDGPLLKKPLLIISPVFSSPRFSPFFLSSHPPHSRCVPAFLAPTPSFPRASRPVHPSLPPSLLHPSLYPPRASSPFLPAFPSEPTGSFLLSCLLPSLPHASSWDARDLASSAEEGEGGGRRGEEGGGAARSAVASEARGGDGAPTRPRSPQRSIMAGRLCAVRRGGGVSQPGTKPFVPRRTEEGRRGWVQDAGRPVPAAQAFVWRS